MGMTDVSNPTDTALPANHALRDPLNDEIHARPPEPLSVPCRVSYLALVSDDAAKNADIGPVIALCERYGITPPAAGMNHYQGDFGDFRLKWERHTEFIRYTFVVDGIPNADDVFETPAISAVPSDWIATLPGQLMVSSHAALVQGSNTKIEDEDTAHRYFNNNPLIGAFVGGQQGTAVTDFRVQDDGFSRVILWDHGMTARQAGRTIQRLFEIDTYRIMALMGLPAARGIGPFLTQPE